MTWSWVGEEDLRGDRREESMIRIYCMEKILKLKLKVVE